MTDRELLELAAKAAGIEHYGEHNAQGGLKTTGGWWNPLTDDGDALRLAVKLKIWEHFGMGAFSDRTDTESDPYAAMRRDIVRTAAEIGRAMP